MKGSIDDIAGLLEEVEKQLVNVEYHTVQLGVALCNEDKQEAWDPSWGAEDDDGSKAAKATVLSRLQKEFQVRHADVEIVSQFPDLKIEFDMKSWVFLAPTHSAVFLYGRYRKLVRGIPQTRWPCAACSQADKHPHKGKRKRQHPEDPTTVKEPTAGPCEACQGTGLQYPESVQDLLGGPIVKALQAQDCTFHGMGREDIDVKCTGNGRPFVMELKAPERRTPSQPLDVLAREVTAACGGKVELVGPLRFSTRAEPVRLKSAESQKTYTIRFRVVGGIDESKDTPLLMGLSGQTLKQRTPTRVEHRRADLIRERKIVQLSKLIVEGEEVQVTIRAESGTYIKEFVHSDEGRTVPSVAGTLGRKCEVLWLDVEDIHAD